MEKNKEMGLFYVDLVILTTALNAGLSLVRSLSLLSEYCVLPETKKIFPNIEEEVQSGNTFANAVKKHGGKCWSSTFVLCEIEEGERNGNLAVHIGMASDYVRLQAKPKPEKILVPEETPVQLVSKVVLALLEAKLAPEQLTKFIKEIVKFKRLQGRIKHQREAYLLRLMAILLQAGIPILKTMELVASEALPDEKLEQLILEARARVREGDSLYYPLQKNKVFSPITSVLIRIGEETGSLDTTLFVAADILGQEIV